MQQPAPFPAERRSEPRLPKAFAFYFRCLGDRKRVSAWMLDISRGGAAFLTAAEKVPAIGHWIELSEMPARDRLVREDAGPLPRYARILRHDECKGLTQRVAVRFETPQHALLDTPRSRLASASENAPHRAPFAPPPADTPHVVRCATPVIPPAESSAAK